MEINQIKQKLKSLETEKNKLEGVQEALQGEWAQFGFDSIRESSTFFDMLKNELSQLERDKIDIEQQIKTAVDWEEL